MKAPSAVWRRSSLGSLGAPNTGATARYLHTCAFQQIKSPQHQHCYTSEHLGLNCLDQNDGVNTFVYVCLCVSGGKTVGSVMSTPP